MMVGGPLPGRHPAAARARSGAVPPHLPAPSPVQVRRRVGPLQTRATRTLLPSVLLSVREVPLGTKINLSVRDYLSVREVAPAQN